MEELLAMTAPWVWWLSLFGFPLTLSGVLLRSFSARRSFRWKLGHALLDAGVTLLAVAAILYFVLPAVAEALRDFPLPGSDAQ